MNDAKSRQSVRCWQPGMSQGVGNVRLFDPDAATTDPEPVVLLLTLTPSGRTAYRNRLYAINPHCAYCGRRIKKRKSATIDHVVPRSRGGLDMPSNLRLACADCNQSKGERTPLEWAWDVLRGATPKTHAVESEGGAA